MDDAGSQSLLKSVLEFFAQRSPESPVHPASPESPESPESPKSWAREAWLRADAILQHDEFDEMTPERIAQTLRAFETMVEDDTGLELDSVSTFVR